MASISLGQIDLMGPLRAAAVEQVNSWFNDRARENLHDDLAALASGKPDAILAREQHKRQVLAKIVSAASPEELQTVLSQGI